MTKDDIIRMAREAGFVSSFINEEKFEHFAHLVAAAEREACAAMWDAEDCLFEGPNIAHVIRARTPKSPEDLNPGDDYA